MNPYKEKDLKKFIESIPQEEIDRQIRLQDEDNKRVYEEFIDSIKIGKCFLCGGHIESYIVDKPCFHWFTYPVGIKKKHFKKYLSSPIGFFQLDSYFRWLANLEKPIGNINDLKAETSETSYLETTYKFKNIEWAFSIGHTDKEGHSNAKVGSFPHFHIQMKINDKVFLKFNDFHIPFSDGDLFTIALIEQSDDKVKLGHSFGHGIGILEDEENLEIIDAAMKVAEDFETASFHTQSIIQAPEGQTIPMELIQKALEESSRTKVPIRKVIRKLMPEATIITQINPGKGVPKMTKRSGKK